MRSNVLIGSFVCLLMSSLHLQARVIELNIHCWEGYAKPHIRAFQALIKEKYQLDVKLNITYAVKLDEFWTLSRARRVDLISPPHNILKSKKWPFIRGGVALPINTKLLSNYDDLLPFVKENNFIIEDKKIYGVPYAMGLYGLAYNADKVSAPTSWNVLWQPQNKNRYSISRDYAGANTYIAALALNASHKQIYDTHSLWSHLGVGTLQQKLSLLAAGANTLWKGTDAPKELDRLHYATTWGSVIYKANREGLNWKMAQPIEGSTIWVDYWVMTYALKGDLLKQKIALEWINFNISPAIQSHLSQQWGTPMVTHYPNKTLSQKEQSNAALNIDPKVTNNSLWEILDTRSSNRNKILWRNAMDYRNKQQ